MMNGERFRPYGLAISALFMLRSAFGIDYAPVVWIAAGGALFFAAAAGWFFRDVRAKTGQ